MNRKRRSTGSGRLFVIILIKYRHLTKYKHAKHSTHTPLSPTVDAWRPPSLRLVAFSLLRHLSTVLLKHTFMYLAPTVLIYWPGLLVHVVRSLNRRSTKVDVITSLVNITCMNSNNVGSRRSCTESTASLSFLPHPGSNRGDPLGTARNLFMCSSRCSWDRPGSKHGARGHG